MIMCERTRPRSGSGYQQHRKLGENACDECRAELRAYLASLRSRPQAQTLQRRHHRTKAYRLSEADYLALLSAQGGACAICGRSLAALLARDIHIDHDHRCDHPGKGTHSCAYCVRGILCRRCNLTIAILDDLPQFARARQYLRNWRKSAPGVIRASRADRRQPTLLDFMEDDAAMQ